MLDLTEYLVCKYTTCTQDACSSSPLYSHMLLGVPISTIIIYTHDYTASAHLLHQCQALYSQHAMVVVFLSHGADPKPQFHQLNQSVHNTTK